MAAALDAAIRMSERGGLGALLPELARIAVMAGVLPCAAAQGEVDRDATTIDGEAGEVLELRLPGDQRASGAKALVEDVTAARAVAQGERQAAADRAEFFALRRFLPFAHKLVATIGAEWLPLMSDAQRHAHFDVFFVSDSEEATRASILALGSALSNAVDDYTARHMVRLAGTWLAHGGLKRLLRARSSEVPGPGVSGEQFADALQVLVSLPDRVANRLHGRVPPEFLPAVYFSQLVADALAVVTSDAADAMGTNESARAEWIVAWLGAAGDSSSWAPLATSSLHEMHESAGCRSEQMRHRRSVCLCQAVGELLGKISVCGKSRTVAAALLSLASRGLKQNGGIAAGEGRFLNGCEGRRKGESIVAYLTAAAAEERAAVERVLESSKWPLFCVVGREVLRHVPSRALEPLLTALVEAQENAGCTQRGKGLRVDGVGMTVVSGGLVSTHVVALVAPLVRERWDVELIVCQRFLTGKTLPEIALARVASLLVACHVLGAESAADSCGLAAAAQRLAALFSDDGFANCGADRQQNHCCGLLTRCVLHLGKDALERSPVIPLILQAVQVRLLSPTAAARKRAMLLAQVFAYVMDSESPLQFEEFHSDDEDDAQSVGSGDGAPGANVFGPECKRTSGDCDGNQNEGSELIAEEGPARSKTKAVRKWQPSVDPDQLMVASDSDSSAGDEDEESDEEDDDERESGNCGCLMSGRTGVNGSGEALKTHALAREEEEDEDESDDGLVAYDMTEDESDGNDGSWAEVTEGGEHDGGPLRIGEGRVPLPTSLRQCLTGLRSKNADDVEAAVFAVADLAERSPDLGGEICSEVALALLRLEDRIAMDDFSGRRYRGLVMLTCADPAPVAVRFSECVCNANEALACRLDALDVLAHAATLLSALSETTAPPAVPSRADLQPSFDVASSVSDERAGAGYGIYNPSSGKTRRWSNRSKVRQAATGVNEFGPLLEVFFFGLLQGLHDSSAASRLLGMDFLLLGRVVAILGVYIECGSHSPATRVASAALVPVLCHASLRHHPQAYVRRCEHAALACLLTTPM